MSEGEGQFWKVSGGVFIGVLTTPCVRMVCNILAPGTIATSEIICIEPCEDVNDVRTLFHFLQRYKNVGLY